MRRMPRSYVQQRPQREPKANAYNRAAEKQDTIEELQSSERDIEIMHETLEAQRDAIRRLEEEYNLLKAGYIELLRMAEEAMLPVENLTVF